MSVNIACSVSECTNPVIGQCTGYKRNCGRYYCREHSQDTLCADCASQKAADEHAVLVYQEYLALAEKVSKEPIQIPKFQFQAKNLVKVGCGSFVIGTILLMFLILVGTIVGKISQQIPQGIIVLYALAILVAFTLISWPIGVIPLVWLIQYQDWTTKERQKRISARINQIEQEKPGFTQFWNAWVKQRQEEQAEKNKQALMGALAVAGVIAAAAIGAALSESDYDRTRRAVRDELNSR